jgi:hypothetical protein
MENWVLGAADRAPILIRVFVAALDCLRLGWIGNWIWTGVGTRRGEMSLTHLGRDLFRAKPPGALSGRLSHVGRSKSEIGLVLSMCMRCFLSAYYYHHWSSRS